MTQTCLTLRVICQIIKIILFTLFLDEERRVKDEKDQIQEIKDLLRDKTLRANELEVGNL